MSRATSAALPAFAALVASVLGGCATVHPCSPNPPPAWSSEQVVLTPYRTQASDETCLQAFEWKPRAGTVRGVVVVVHGIRDHASRYGTLAQTLGEHGLAVYAQDHRGHGQSGGDRQRFDSMDQLVGDVDIAVAEAKKRHPGVPVFLYGHSLGGLVATEYALAHGDSLRGLVLSGAALKLLPGVSGGQQTAAHVFGAILPGLPAQAVDDRDFVRDPAAKADMAADPLIDHGNLPARSAAAALDGIADVQRRMEQLKVPVLIMHGTVDKATNVEGSQELYARATSTDKTLKLYDGLFHDLLHEPEHDRVIQDVTAWITARLQPAVAQGGAPSFRRAW